MNTSRVLALMVGLFGFGLLLTSYEVNAAETTSVTGKLSVKKDKRKTVRSAQLRSEDGKAFTITLDKKGRELAAKDEGSEWVVEGAIVKKGKLQTIKVTSFKAPEAKKEGGDAAAPKEKDGGEEMGE